MGEYAGANLPYDPDYTNLYIKAQEYGWVTTRLAPENGRVRATMFNQFGRSSQPDPALLAEALAAEYPEGDTVYVGQAKGMGTFVEVNISVRPSYAAIVERLGRLASPQVGVPQPNPAAAPKQAQSERATAPNSPSARADIS